jgi:hypothetical protein
MATDAYGLQRKAPATRGWLTPRRPAQRLAVPVGDSAAARGASWSGPTGSYRRGPSRPDRARHVDDVQCRTRAHSAETAGSAQTAGERLADAAQLAATARTVAGSTSSRSTACSRPSSGRGRRRGRRSLPCPRAAPRRTGGEVPRQLVDDAVTERPLAGATNTTNVLHSRITDGNTRRFEPIGANWAEWAPRTGHADWDAYLGALAAAADQRVAELGREVAEEAPAWALDTFGPVPADPQERAGWEQRAGVVAAYREFRGHADEREPLGPAPKPGQVEAYAAYRQAWRIAGRPEIDRAEHEMSDGLHRKRILAWEREKAWGPRYVGNELAGTRQAADQHRRNAVLRDAGPGPAGTAPSRGRPGSGSGRDARRARRASWRSSTTAARSGSSTPPRPGRRPRSPSASSPSGTPTTPSPSSR